MTELMSMDSQADSCVIISSHGMTVTRRILNQGGMSIELLEIDNGQLRVVLLPQRGMSVWKAWLNDVCIGWKSPVDGPVHPLLVPVFDPSGLGWLEGFDELLCRCGLSSNGAPDFDKNGRLIYPLHGRISNLPAVNVQIQQDPLTGTISITGDVYETRIHFQKLRLRSTITMHPERPAFEIHDVVENLSSNPAQVQLLYHYNIGDPVLSAGAQVVAPIAKLVPRDSRAAYDWESWNKISAPNPEYTEQVYFTQLHADHEQKTLVMLKNAESDFAASIQFRTSELPYFVIWKNTVSSTDGYACGMEPSTNFPNQRTFEGANGRTVALQPLGSTSFSLTFSFHSGTNEVVEVAAKIMNLSHNRATSFIGTPTHDWCGSPPDFTSV